MKKLFSILVVSVLLFSLAACGTVQSGQQLEDASSLSGDSGTVGEQKSDDSRKIQITTGSGNKMIFQLNHSPAADSFYRQLPLSVSVEDYAGSEKIFYPSEELDTRNTPLAKGPSGTLAYYAPWGNIAIFYEECRGASGLYGLGEVITGAEFISELTGEIQIELVDASSASRPENASSQSAQAAMDSSTESEGAGQAADGSNSEEIAAIKMKVQIGSNTFTATLEENAAVDALVQRLKNAPVTIQMRDYSGFEKVGSLGVSLPANNEQITTQAGDIVLYNGDQIVVFYGSNSWNYTRLGTIDDLTGWKEALGNGDVTITFSLE